MATMPPELYGLPISEVARICRISLKTARRWKRGQTVPPETALMMLRRDLGCFHPNWSGWHISERGELCSPENWIATPGNVRGIQLFQAQLSAYQLENRALRAEIEALEGFEDQPLPSEIPAIRA